MLHAIKTQKWNMTNWKVNFSFYPFKSGFFLLFGTCFLYFWLDVCLVCIKYTQKLNEMSWSIWSGDSNPHIAGNGVNSSQREKKSHLGSMPWGYMCVLVKEWGCNFQSNLHIITWHLYCHSPRMQIFISWPVCIVFSTTPCIVAIATVVNDISVQLHEHFW